MRVATSTQLLEARPGESASVAVDVVNTGGVIDGVSARVIGLPAQSVRADPELLSLFPDSSGQLTLSLDVPATQPAGRHPLTVEVVSHGAHFPSQFVDLDLEVSAGPAMTLAARPRTIRARREGRFVLELANTGNVALLVRPAAADVDRVVRTSFAPVEVRLEPGAVAPVLLSVQGPRIVVGAEIDRVVTVRTTATRVPMLVPTSEPVPLIEPAPAAELAPAVPRGDDLSLETTVRLRQRPLLSRGLLTALILVAIIALWALIFVLSLAGVFNGDPATKTAPASFFAASTSTAAPDAGGAQPGTAPGTEPGTAPGSAGGSGDSGGAPAGAPAKTGRLAPGVGGTLTGTVTAASNKQGVGRFVVVALRKVPPTGSGAEVAPPRSGCQRVAGYQAVGSAATQTDGTYSMAGLFPGDYLVQFCAKGYPTRLWPTARTPGSAKPVRATVQHTTGGINLVAKGETATISGTLDTGDSRKKITTTVGVQGLDTDFSTSVKTSSTKFAIEDLPAPATYKLTYTTPDYRATTLVETVAAGQELSEPEVQLTAGPGQISGTVKDGSGDPVGGVSVTTSVAGKPMTVTTPTVGRVGVFVLDNLPTPATYVITVSKPGSGTFTKVVDLTAGESATESVELASGTGSVSGTLVDARKRGLGGAKVTVGGALQAGGTPQSSDTGTTGTAGTTTGDAAPSTTTLTEGGATGRFVVNGLTAPGSYTLTFTLDGYAPVTIPVELTASGPVSVQPMMAVELGDVAGRVTYAGSTFVGATVTVTDGHQTWTTTSTALGPTDELPRGGYLVTGLTPGAYAVTVSADGKAPQTRLVTITAGDTAKADLALQPEDG